MRIEDDSVRVIVAANDKEWSERAADHFLEAARAASAIRNAFHVVVPGGSTPRAAFARVTEQVPARDRLWRDVHVYFGDERVVEPDHPESNYRMIREAWLAGADIPPDQVHRIETELGPEEAAARYADLLGAYLGRLPDEASAGRFLAPEARFDLVLLGLGRDGHVASLIPDRALDFVAGGWVGVGQAPLSPAQVRRVTLTAAALRATREAAFWVRGPDKAAVVRSALLGEVSTMVPQVIPQPGRVTWILDREAARDLP